jgi:hypothetical protein
VVELDMASLPYPTDVGCRGPEQHQVRDGAVVRRAGHASTAHSARAPHAGLDIADAFKVLRDHARNHDERLVDVARLVVDGSLAAAALEPL